MQIFTVTQNDLIFYNMRASLFYFQTDSLQYLTFPFFRRWEKETKQKK